MVAGRRRAGQAGVRARAASRETSSRAAQTAVPRAETRVYPPGVGGRVFACQLAARAPQRHAHPGQLLNDVIGLGEDASDEVQYRGVGGIDQVASSHEHLLRLGNSFREALVHAPQHLR